MSDIYQCRKTPINRRRIGPSKDSESHSSTKIYIYYLHSILRKCVRDSSECVMPDTQ